MINTALIFAIDDITASLEQRKRKINEEIKEKYNQNNNARIASLISERDYLTEQIDMYNQKKEIELER